VIILKIRKVIKMIERDGWYLARTSGDHRQYKPHEKPGLVTISGHPDDDIGKGTLNSVLKQAGLKIGERLVDDFNRYRRMRLFLSPSSLSPSFPCTP
jgi:predicted RNA binding protein YcfA (HicA-like mRNA interferase family)